ncbi:MAG TPA: hypothetical protein VI935_07600, partial [Thermodesulfobacteriota bacterium]|nr:hypothetical protein [Thermodesulfobacteriota bacterium]
YTDAKMAFHLNNKKGSHSSHKGRDQNKQEGRIPSQSKEFYRRRCGTLTTFRTTKTQSFLVERP